uniref:Late embryogenesis abundant protein LEA-2 subgroup domain-containing protein n=1 Tax=Oryza punctata TaxID=4537 RepID=A0A0E0K2I5_ORYPU
MGVFPEQEHPPLLLHRRGSFRPEEEAEDDEYTDAFGVCFGLFLAIFAIMLVVLWIRRPDAEGMAASPPDYFVAINAVSGLDPSTDLGRPALDPAFSLTVRVASRSSTRGACVRAGAAVLVSYRGVPLAGGRAPDPELCAGPMGAAEDGSVVARGSGVSVPGPQLDALAEDMRRGEALFEVTLAMPYYGQRKVASCWDRVGDAAALRVPCDVSLVDPRRLAGISGFSDLPIAKQPFLPLRNGGGTASGSRAARGCSRTSQPSLECRCMTLLFVLVAVAFGALGWLAWLTEEYFGPATPQYSVEIASVSGLDPATDLHAGAALDPVFNLTVGIASKGLYCGVCIEPRTAVKVSYSYLGLPLAGGRVPEVCAGANEPTEKRAVIARGVGVSVPGYLLDSLAEDMRSGEAVFEVKLIEGDGDRYSRTVATCWARVGGGSDARNPPENPSAMGAAADAEEEETKPILPVTRPAESGAKRAPEEDPCECCTRPCAVGTLVILAIFFWLVHWAVQASKYPEYSVEIAAVSGLDPVADLSGGRAAALNPVFNLTVGVASTSTMYGACIDPVSSVKISYSYQHLPLATAVVQDVCAPPRGKSEELVVARGIGVRVPGFLLDSLAEEMRRGEAKFEVKLIKRLKEPDEHMDTQYRTVLTCWAKVGAKASCYQTSTAVATFELPPSPLKARFGEERKRIGHRRWLAMAAVSAPLAEHELPVHWAVAEPDNTQRRGVLGGVGLRIDAVCLVMVCMILIAVAFLVMMIVAIVKDWTQPASYSVAIDSVAGLDPETDLPGDTLNPEFNLTLRLASGRTDKGVCFVAGTTVAVYYRGVQLAGAAVPTLCAGPRPSAEEESVVACGRRVPVPRLVRDGLAGDLSGGGGAEFDVALTVQRYTYAESWDLVLCSAKVGDAAALTTPCRLYYENVEEPALQPGYGNYSSQTEAPPEAAGDDCSRMADV